MGRTRRVHKKYGGAKLGEGVQAAAYDVYSEIDESLYSMVYSNKTFKIELFLSDGKVKFLNDLEDIRIFIEDLKNHTDFIAKIIKPVSLFSFHSIRGNFLEEIKDNQKVINSYKPKDVDNYITLAGIKFDGMNVTAAIFTGDSSFYAIFNVRCNPMYDFDIKKFTIDILKSLEAFNGTHNDIKLDNIVLCSDKYKLIDWGKYSPRDKLRFGTTTTASPMKYYIYSGIARVGRYYFVKNKRAKTWYNFEEIVKTSEFKFQYTRILNEYDEEVKTTPKKKIFEKYKDTFDVFALGMSILYGVIHFSLDYETYRPLIEALTSIKDPLNASEALSYAKKFFRKV